MGSNTSNPECDIRMLGADRALLRVNKTVSVETALEIARTVNEDMNATRRSNRDEERGHE